MRRALVLLCLLACAAAATATARASSDFTGHHRQVIPVVVVRGLSLADLHGLAQEGAVGLLVPNAGPRTSAGDAFAGMVRGVLYNARLPRPHDLVLIHVTKANEIPRHGPLIVVGLPPAPTRRPPRRTIFGARSTAGSAAWRTWPPTACRSRTRGCSSSGTSSSRR